MKTIIAIAIIWAAAAHVAYADTGATAENSSASTPVGSRFAVQLGVFADDEVALEWVSKLKAAGVPAYVEHRTQDDGPEQVLLRAGPFKDRASAAKAIAKVRQAGLGNSEQESENSGAESKQDAPAARQASSNTEYVANLRATYGKRLHFGSTEAERIVRSFNIDCRLNGRYVPLINLLYARLAQMTTKTLWLESYVQARGGEVRIVDILRGPAAHDAPEKVSFEINQWGNLHPVGFSAEAVLNTCFGSYGPIWQK